MHIKNSGETKFMMKTNAQKQRKKQHRNELSAGRRHRSPSYFLINTTDDITICSMHAMIILSKHVLLYLIAEKKKRNNIF
jgi:hypothetical protein